MLHRMKEGRHTHTVGCCLCDLEGWTKLINGEESQEKGSLLVGILTRMGHKGVFPGAGNVLCLNLGRWWHGYVCKKPLSCTFYGELYLSFKINLKFKKKEYQIIGQVWEALALA